MPVDPLPQVRIVRHAGQVMAPPPAPRRNDGEPGILRTVLIYADGMWPLICVGLAVAGLLVLTAHMQYHY